jgi:hypothetical protein
MEGRWEGLMEVRTEGRSASLKGAPMAVRLVGLRVVRTVGLRVVRTVDRSADQMGAQKEGPTVDRLVDLQGLLEVLAVLHWFAQLVLVPVQAQLPVLRALVVLGLEVEFARADRLQAVLVQDLQVVLKEVDRLLVEKEEDLLRVMVPILLFSPKEVSLDHPLQSC